MTYMTRQQQAILACIQSCDGGIGAASAPIHRVLLDTERGGADHRVPPFGAVGKGRQGSQNCDGFRRKIPVLHM